MKNRWKVIPALSLSVILAVGSLLPYSTTYAKDSKVEALEIQTSELESKLSSLNKQVTELSSELDSITTELNTTNEDIEHTKIELVESKEAMQEQYDAMKKRIKYMYENNNESLLQLIFSSDSMADFVNKADFVSNVSGYDRDMLEQLSTIQEEISEKEKKLNKNKKKLTTLQDELVEKQQELNDKVAETSAALTNSKTELAAAEQAALEKEKAIKGAADGQTTASSGNTNSSGSSSKNHSSSSNNSNDKPDSSLAGDTSNVAALAAIIECEAGGECYKGKVAVGAVVLNRVSSSRYPNTIMGVITQKNQFSPVASGRFAIVLARGAASSCVQAANDALAGSDPTGGCLSFRATWSGDYDGLVIGNQVFF